MVQARTQESGHFWKRDFFGDEELRAGAVDVRNVGGAEHSPESVALKSSKA